MRRALEIARSLEALFGTVPAVMEAVEELRRLDDLINNPHTEDFLEAVRLEAAHQRERWSTEHDAGKTPEDWLWLVAFLATKAGQAARYGDLEKYLHHLITAAAALKNWHANASGVRTDMRPGAPEPSNETGIRSFDHPI